MSHSGMTCAMTRSLGGIIKRIFLTKNSNEITLFLAIFEINSGFRSQFMVFSISENIGRIFETLRQRLHRNRRARQIGRLIVKC